MADYFFTGSPAASGVIAALAGAFYETASGVIAALAGAFYETAIEQRADA